MNRDAIALTDTAEAIGEEKWRPIPCNENYLASTHGRIRSLHKGGRILRAAQALLANHTAY